MDTDFPMGIPAIAQVGGQPFDTRVLSSEGDTVHIANYLSPPLRSRCGLLGDDWSLAAHEPDDPLVIGAHPCRLCFARGEGRFVRPWKGHPSFDEGWVWSVEIYAERARI